MSDEQKADLAPLINARLGGFDATMGVRVVRASAEEVVVEYEVDDRHRQPYGIVHGGMHCAVVETACSMGAGLAAQARGLAGVVGLENHTSFIRAVRKGRVQVMATPITRGRRSQLWEATARDAEGRVVASGRVRLLCLEAEAVLAGEKLGVRDVSGG